MNIGGYLSYVLGSENIDKKNLYDKVKTIIESTEGPYITYSRFCSKINNDTLTAKEFIYIAAVLGEKFDCNKFLQTVTLELPLECDCVLSQQDIEISKLREQLDFWYDYEVLFLNNKRFDFYKTIPNVKLLNEETSTINMIVKYIDNFTESSDKDVEKPRETGVEDVNYLSYSYETDELRLEKVIFATDITETSNSPVPHNVGKKGHGGYRELFYTKKLKKYLQANGMTCDDFEQKSLADKIDCVTDWMITRNYLAGENVGEYIQFDI